MTMSNPTGYDEDDYSGGITACYESCATDCKHRPKPAPPEVPVKSLVCIHCGAESFCPACDEPERDDGDHDEAVGDFDLPPEVPAPDDWVHVELDWQTGFAVGAWSDGDGVSYCKKDHRNTLVRYVRAREGGR